MLKSWSSTQSVVALSSGESEYYGVVKGASEGLGIKSILGDWGYHREIKLWTDSSAAKGMASRIGLSKKTRHIAVHFLWVQEKVEAGQLSMHKVAGEKNTADMATKYLTNEAMRRLLGKLPVEMRS